MDVDALFAELRKNSDAEAPETQEVEKTASAEPKKEEGESMEKLAGELYAGGQLFAEGFADRLIEKLAGSGVPAAGAGIASPKSKWEAVGKKIERLKSHGGVGDNSVVRAEAEAMSGAKGVVNTAKPLT